MEEQARTAQADAKGRAGVRALMVPLKVDPRIIYDDDVPLYRSPVVQREDDELLRRAVNESTDECAPGCDSYGHEADCPSCNPARWLIDQQREIEQLRAAKVVQRVKIDAIADEVFAMLPAGAAPFRRDRIREILERHLGAVISHTESHEE